MTTAPEHPSGETRLRTAITALLVTLLVLLGVSVTAFLLLPSGEDQDVRAQIGGPFTLTAHTGETVTDQTYNDKLKLIFFGFTYCPDVCPISLSTMTRTMEMLGDEAERVQPLFITIDPERDTAEALAQYVTHFHPSLVALTGSQEAIADVAQSYFVGYTKVYDESATDYLMDHSVLVYLMSEDNDYLAHFNHQTSPEEVASTIREHL